MSSRDSTLELQNPHPHGVFELYVSGTKDGAPDQRSIVNDPDVLPWLGKPVICIQLLYFPVSFYYAVRGPAGPIYL